MIELVNLPTPDPGMSHQQQAIYSLKGQQQSITKQLKYKSKLEAVAKIRDEEVVRTKPIRWNAKQLIVALSNTLLSPAVTYQNTDRQQNEQD